MALDFDDRILGEKVNNYISSSEDEDEEPSDLGETGNEDRPGHSEYRYGGHSEDPRNAAPVQERVTEAPLRDPNRGTSMTGPKGVMEDYRRFKQLEAEKRKEQQQELLALTKRLAFTCEPASDRNEDDEFMSEFDSIFEEYAAQRMQEMESMLANVPSFGKVLDLFAESFVAAIDQEHPLTTIIVLIYDPVNQKACDNMYGCFQCLATVYDRVKFCRISAEEAGLSDKFRATATPALQVYKNKELVNSFIQLSEDFDEEFFAVDVEQFLMEHSLLPTNESRLLQKSTVDDLD